MGRFLGADQAKEFYDRAGSKMSSQDFYEDRAVDDLIAHSAFESASRVFELGFGMGQLAEKLLRFHLKSSAKYYGVDISSTMLGVARERLHPYDSQVTLTQTDGILKFNFPDTAFDRFVTTFVLDILSPEDITTVLHEAHRLLVPGVGYLCLANLTNALGLSSKIVMNVWKLLFKISPRIVGGCRPIDVKAYVTPPDWNVEYSNTIVSRGVASQVLVARKL